MRLECHFLLGLIFGLWCNLLNKLRRRTDLVFAITFTQLLRQLAPYFSTFLLGLLPLLLLFKQMRILPHKHSKFSLQSISQLIIMEYKQSLSIFLFEITNHSLILEQYLTIVY